MAIKPSADGQGITLMKLDKVEWWSTQPRLWRHTNHTQTCSTQARHIRTRVPFCSIFFPHSPDLLGACFHSSSVLPSPFLHFPPKKHPAREPARCSTWEPVSSSGKLSLVCPEHCRQPVSPSSLPSTLPKHTQTHVSTSPPLTGRCHSGRQLHSLVWRLPSNQRSSSLSTETWPWGNHCHTAYTPCTHKHTDWWGKDEDKVEEEVAVFYQENRFPLY